MAYKALVIGFDEHKVSTIRDSLCDANIEIEHQSSGDAAYKCFICGTFILVILDLHLPEFDPIRLLASIHQHEPVPIIALSSTPTNEEMRAVLGAGADHYWRVPTDTELVSAHVKALVRRYITDTIGKREQSTLTLGCGLKLDFKLKKAFLSGEPLQLHPKQFALLAILAMRAGEIVSKDDLCTAIWEDNYEIGCEDSFRYHLRKLKRQLEAHGASGMIQTHWGNGYSLSGNWPDSSVTE